VNGIGGSETGGDCTKARKKSEGQSLVESSSLMVNYEVILRRSSQKIAAARVGKSWVNIERKMKKERACSKRAKIPGEQKKREECSPSLKRGGR